MSNRKPNHADAELVLRLYDLRREPVMRESRKAMLRFLPKTFEEVQAVTSFEHPDNAAWRQVSSYFEYAFGFARHGIVPADFLAEYNGEGFLLYAKIEPFLAQYRAATSATAFGNAEWVVKHSSFARKRVELFRARLATQRGEVAAASATGAGKKAKKSKDKRRGK
jgi:hypothetical protein